MNSLRTSLVLIASAVIGCGSDLIDQRTGDKSSEDAIGFLVDGSTTSYLNVYVSESGKYRADYPDRGVFNPQHLAVGQYANKMFLLKFKVSGIGNRSIKSAILVLHSVNDAQHGGDLYFVRDGDFDKDTTYVDAPQGADFLKRVAIRGYQAHTKYSRGVTDLINADGTYIFRIDGGKKDTAKYENDPTSPLRPRLKITFADDGQDPPPDGGGDKPPGGGGDQPPDGGGDQPPDGGGGQPPGNFDICLARSGPQQKIHGSQSSKFREYGLQDNLVLDARTAVWDSVDAFPVQLGGKNLCLSGGLVDGGFNAATDWDTFHSAAALYVKSPGIIIEDFHARWGGDGIRIRQGSSNFLIRRAYLDKMGDDCIENDSVYGGVVDDSLLICHMAFSARPSAGDGSADGRNNLWTIQNTLVYLRPQMGVYRGATPGHGGFFKWDTHNDRSPKLALKNNIFRADQDSNYTTMGIPPGKLKDCSNNIMVWLGKGSYPEPLPPCFTITRDKGVWDRAVEKWKRDHGH